MGRNFDDEIISINFSFTLYNILWVQSPMHHPNEVDRPLPGWGCKTDRETGLPSYTEGHSKKDCPFLQTGQDV